jgi:outer membrane protein TolC
LFDSGVRRANREQARARVLEEKASCDAVKQRVRRDVTAAWVSLQAAEENVRTSAAAVAEAEESFRAVQLRYRTRRSNQAELYDALSARRQVRIDQLQALYDYSVARARLDRATGRI